MSDLRQISKCIFLFETSEYIPRTHSSSTHKATALNHQVIMMGWMIQKRLQRKKCHQVFVREKTLHCEVQLDISCRKKPNTFSRRTALTFLDFLKVPCWSYAEARFASTTWANGTQRKTSKETISRFAVRNIQKGLTKQKHVARQERPSR